MKLNKKYYCCLILLFLVISTTSLTAKANDETEEWKVKVGDSMTYTLSKYFDIRDIDGNGDAESKNYSVLKEDGTSEDVILKKGSKYTVNITALNHSATFQLIFGNITSNKRHSGMGDYLQKTIDNKSYWEREAIVDSLNIFDDTNYTVEGNYYVQWKFDSKDQGYELKRNWKTGWIIYLYEKVTNDTHTIREEEITSVEYTPTTTRTTTTQRITGIQGIEIITIFVGLTIIAIVVSRKRK